MSDFGKLVAALENTDGDLYLLMINEIGRDHLPRIQSVIRQEALPLARQLIEELERCGNMNRERFAENAKLREENERLLIAFEEELECCKQRGEENERLLRYHNIANQLQLEKDQLREKNERLKGRENIDRINQVDRLIDMNHDLREQLKRAEEVVEAAKAHEAPRGSRLYDALRRYKEGQ